MKYAWIDAQRREYPLPDMCQVLLVSISGYRAWRRGGITADIVTDALTMAWFRRKPAAGVIFHSDRGSQYASQAMRARLSEYGMTASMSRKGNCWDNAPSESFFNSLKNERVHGSNYETRADAEADLFQYIEVFYNRSRRHSTLGYSSPIRFLQDWISKHDVHQSKAA